MTYTLNHKSPKHIIRTLYKVEGLTFSNLALRLGMKYFFQKRRGWTEGDCLETGDFLLRHDILT